jgi:hypothetical protein
VSDPIHPWFFSGTLGGILLLAAVVWLWYRVRRSQRAGTPGGAHGRTRPRLVAIHQRARRLLPYVRVRLSPQGALGLFLTLGALLLKQHLDNLRRKDALREAETAEISVRLGNYSASHFEGSALIVASWLFGALRKDILIQHLLLGMDRKRSQGVKFTTH